MPALSGSAVANGPLWPAVGVRVGVGSDVTPAPSSCRR